MATMTKEDAEQRATAVLAVMPEWKLNRIKRDGTVCFEIVGKRSSTFIEFAPEHWQAFDAMSARQ